MTDENCNGSEPLQLDRLIRRLREMAKAVERMSGMNQPPQFRVMIDPPNHESEPHTLD